MNHLTENDSCLSNQAIIQLWSKIVDKVHKSRYKDGPYTDHFHNEVINGVYYRETAFAIKILLTEWKRTNKFIYKESSIDSIKALVKVLSNEQLELGIDEPVYALREIKYRKGSIPSTILLLFALKESLELLGDSSFFIDTKIISKFLNKCKLGKGRYYHDVIDHNTAKYHHHVLNTSAMALAYYSYVIDVNHKIEFAGERSDIVNRLIKSQRKDGFWPYIEPNKLQKLFFPYIKLIHNNSKNLFLSDASIYFGDAVHHCITLRLLLESYSTLEDDKYSMSRVDTSIVLAWQFIKSNLIDIKDNMYKFNFDFEPKLRSIRYCNFMDTSTYFYIIEIANSLKEKEFISKDEHFTVTTYICNYIINNLMNSKTIINPYDGHKSKIQKIMPRPAESVFDKGYLLSNCILNINK